jgi:FkbM family methyltransferase
VIRSGKRYSEFRGGFDALRYLLTYGLLTRLARKVSKRKHKFFVQVESNIDRHILSEGFFEGGVIRALEDIIIATGHTTQMIDIGGNIGNHSVALAHLFKNIDAVEPHPVLFRVMEANFINNSMGHARSHNFGLAGEDATGTLAESSENHGLSRVKERSQLSPEVFGLSEASFAKEHTIQLKDAAEFVGRFNSVLDDTFIKIDVEGMEMEIVTAIVPLLKQHTPLVAFEWFTASQTGFTELLMGLPRHELWAIDLHDVGKSRFKRAIKLLFTGRVYTLERIDPNNLKPVYPLALLLPKSTA